MNNIVGKLRRYMSEKLTSVEDKILTFQDGLIASKINTAYTFIPCGIVSPINVQITPVKLSTTSANGVAFFTTTGGYQADSLEILSATSDLDAHAASIAYVVGNIVKATPTDGSLGAYLCITAHTSSTGPDFDADIANWVKLKETAFIKLTHTAAGAGKVAHFTYKVEGYDN